MHGKNKLLVILALSLAVIMVLPAIFGKIADQTKKYVSYSEFVNIISQEKITHAVMEGAEITFLTKENNTPYMTNIISTDSGAIVDKLIAIGAKVDIIPKRTGGLKSSFANIVSGVISLMIPLAIIWFISRKSLGQSGGGINRIFGGEQYDFIDPADTNAAKVTFADIAGIDEAKDEVVEIIDFLKNHEKFTNMGARIPKGCLLYGPPGTGKTMLAKCIAGEALVPFFATSGSEFVEMFVGLGAKRVRDLFNKARSKAPCILFLDEIDAIGRKRGAGGMAGSNEEREQALNQILVEMDGFKSAQHCVIVIAATNRPEVLDEALLRPGRFDRRIGISLPDIDAREKILNVCAKRSKAKISPDVDMRIIARGTPGFSGADLDNIINEAALFAAKNDKLVITSDDFEYAKDKILMGSERKSMIMSADDKELTAYHEAGHTIAGVFIKGTDPLHKVTIIPRGKALGVTMSLPEKDKYCYKKYEIEAKLIVLMSGRAAEIIVYGEDMFTTGASDDFKQATHLAVKMVTEWGMSEKVGPIRYLKNSMLNDSEEYRLDSPDMAKIIDEEVKYILDKAMKKSMDLLNDKIDKLHLLAKTLLEHETLDAKDIDDLMKKGALTHAPAKKATTSSDSTPSVASD